MRGGGIYVDLEGHPDADPPVPPHVDVWRSVRAHRDTKTNKSRRSLRMPTMAVEVLREHLERQAAARRRAGVLWEGQRMVFTTALGTQLDAADVRLWVPETCATWADALRDAVGWVTRTVPGGRSGSGWRAMIFGLWA